MSIKQINKIIELEQSIRFDVECIIYNVFYDRLEYFKLILDTSSDLYNCIQYLYTVQFIDTLYSHINVYVQQYCTGNINQQQFNDLFVLLYTIISLIHSTQPITELPHGMNRTALSNAVDRYILSVLTGIDIQLTVDKLYRICNHNKSIAKHQESAVLQYHSPQYNKYGLYTSNIDESYLPRIGNNINAYRSNRHHIKHNGSSANWRNHTVSPPAALLNAYAAPYIPAVQQSSNLSSDPSVEQSSSDIDNGGLSVSDDSTDNSHTSISNNTTDLLPPPYFIALHQSNDIQIYGGMNNVNNQQHAPQYQLQPNTTTSFLSSQLRASSKPFIPQHS